ncbi:hypothetical protein FNV43_RR09948 [Rhamnella rubrinervis]|uniref:Glycosyltransferase n=1 Tax=Rhamnella rubrinervis TaxID=2594499 RepID=A0A8K0HC73_9ROSA|nr:hypothetical protein FNV43_RR09948 [Rhamnella rubrinervis]
MPETIVLFAGPGMGHIISMVELGKLILHHYSHKFSAITILIIQGFIDTPAISDYVQRITQSYPSISFHRIPIQPRNTSQQIPNELSILTEFNRLNPPILRTALQEISKTSTIKALVIDMFCASALSVGIELCIPTYFFFTCGTLALAVFLCLPKFYEQTTPNNFDNPLAYRFPGISLVRPSDLKGLLSVDFLYFCSALSKANGIIVNTFDGFEPVAMKAVEDGLCVPDGPTPPVYYVGPLIGSGNEKGGGKAIAMDEGEEEDYLSWLDKQPSRSVVFLCFGSQGTFSDKQVKEVAIGLENSGKRFLWVLKKPAIDDKTKQSLELKDFDLGSVLPEGFKERTRDVGRVVKSWVSQVEVLKKESVGVFVTHCGWNSILEAVVAGVPMIAWPLYAEQYLNRNALVFDMGMAVPVEQREEDGFVSASELEKRVRELMESEKGRELNERSRSRKMKEMSLDAFEDSGSSKLALKRFIEAID